MIVIDICLSDIPADARTKSEKNGKVYAKFVIDERKDKDQFGNTHSVAINQTKEQRDKKEKKVYVGSGKEYLFNAKPKDYEQLPDSPAQGDGLPF